MMLDKPSSQFSLLRIATLGHRLGDVPGQLSVGERQRTGLARALVHQPKLLLADEPTGNLDPENAEAVLEAMQEFAAEGGAVLLVTHDDRAAKRAQRILRLEQGTIVPDEATSANE